MKFFDQIRAQILNFFAPSADQDQTQKVKATVWIGAVIVALFLAFYLDSHGLNHEDAKVAEDPANASTYIPAGYVLVPIEVANFESLDSILGKYGVVDLYLPVSETRKKPIKVAERIKILRAPLNPSHFAVLATEEDSGPLVANSGAYLVVVQPDRASGTKIVKQSFDTATAENQMSERPGKKPQARISRIEIEEGIRD